MTVQNMWPLVFLILIPAIILLYILKQKAQDQQISSILLWQEIYKNLEAKTPFEKLKNNILMYLQILLMLLLIFALMAPILKKGGKEENVVLVMDTSASMQHAYEGKKTRFEESVERAKAKVDRLSENAMVTLITCDEDASVVFQGKDKIMLKKRLEEMQPTLHIGTLDQSASLVNSLISGMEQVQVIGYTDTSFASKELISGHEHAALTIENLFSKGENCAVSYVNYAVEEDEICALCKVSNYGEQDVTTDVSLYLDREIVDVQTISVSAGESAVVYFSPQPVRQTSGTILKAELSSKDSLIADNEQSIEVRVNEKKKVLLLSKGNVFLEKALSLQEETEVYKSDDINVLNQTEDTYDLYVFDGIEIPETISLPEHGAYMFVNNESQKNGFDWLISEQNKKDCYLHFVQSPVTRFVEDFSFGVSVAKTYALPQWATPLISTSDGAVVSYYGSFENRMISVIGFDIHNTDLALQTEYPIFMSQLTEAMLQIIGEKQEIVNFPESESYVEAMESVQIAGDMRGGKTGGRAIRNLILIIVLLLLLIEWVVYVKQVHSSKKKQYLIVRLFLVLAIICAMTGLSIVKKQINNETIFLVDVSDSMSGNRPEIEKYLNQMIQEMPEKNKAGIVLFGKDTVVDQFMTDKKIFSSFESTPVTTATNIEKAVQSACSLFRDDASKQLILITDGNENEGSMNVAAKTITGKNISFYAIQLEDCISNNKEVYLDGLDVPEVVHVGDHYNIVVSVASNVETTAKITLYSGRTLKGQQEVQLNKGKNQFVFEDEGVDGTIANYRAVVETPDDTISDNNSYVAFTQIEKKPRILIVEGKTDEAKEFCKVLDSANVAYDLVSAKGVPTTVSELNAYKAVVTINAHYDDLRAGFPKALASYVKDFAGGYICIGGDNSFALGGYRNTELEEILPVNMDLRGEKEIPKMAMAMVIDQSGSMCSAASDNSNITGLDLAKQAAYAGVEELRATDEIGVLAFDHSYHWIVPIRTADNIVEIQDQIRSIAYGGGTSIYPAFHEAYLQLLKSDAKLKHIVLLTDGQDGFNDYDALYQLVREAGITVSTVAVGEGADFRLMNTIAEQCGGRSYYTDVNNSIPRIFAQEVYLSTSEYLINEPFYPTIASGNAVLQGVFDEGSPAIYGYIATSAKQTADVLLLSDREDPLLSTWQYGLGKTIAWNSDVTNDWTAECAQWDNYSLLWSNLVHYVMNASNLDGDIVEVQKEGNGAKLHYETKNYDEKTDLALVITDEEGNTKEQNMEAVKPGVYEAKLDADQIGIYSLNVRKKNGEEVLGNFTTGYANQYSAEYKFSNRENDIAVFTKQAGGDMLTMDRSIWDIKQSAVKSRVSLTMFFLILAVLLLLFDILARRLSLDLWGAMKKFFSRFYLVKEQVANGLEERKEEAQKQKEQKKEMKKEKTHEKTTVKKEKKSEENVPEMIDMNQLLKKKRDRE